MLIDINNEIIEYAKISFLRFIENKEKYKER